MILGVDHVALACTDLDAASAILTDSGFSIRFIQDELTNASEKRPFLRQYEPLHGIAYAWSEEGVSLELTRHAQVSSGRGCYDLLLQGRPKGVVALTSSDDSEAVAIRDVLAAAFPGLHPEYYRWIDGSRVWVSDTSDAKSCIKASLLRTGDLASTARLWTEGLGFKVQSKGDEGGHAWIRLENGSPVSRWRLNLVIAEFPSDSDGQPHLDDSGFPCVALLSSDLKSDVRDLGRLGAEQATDCFSIEVDEKDLKVLVCRGASGELIELIEFSRG